MEKLIYIEWADATSPAENTWRDEYEAKQWAKDDDYWIKQVGWILEENNKYILLASHKSITKTDTQIEQFGLLQKIPKTWIRHRKDLTKYIK